MSRFSKLEVSSAQTPSPAEAVRPLAPQGAAPLTFDGIMREADASLYTGDYVGALRLYSQALQENTAQVEPWQGQALALLLQSQIGEAAVWTRRGIEAFPNHPVTVSLHGVVLALQGMTQRGLGTSDYALGLAAPSPLCWVARGWILLEAGNEQWRACFGKAREGGGDWRLEVLMGLILERRRKWVHAAEHYEAALQRQSGNYFLWHRLGVCQARLGFATRAVESQKHALEIHPSYAPAEKALRRLSGFPGSVFFSRLWRLVSGAGAK